MQILQHLRAIAKQSKKKIAHPQHQIVNIHSNGMLFTKRERKHSQRRLLFCGVDFLVIISAVSLPLGIINPEKAYAAACSAGNVTPVHSSTYYIDPGKNITGMYVGYKITNNSGAAYTDLWVKLDNFTGGLVTLANKEPGVVHVGYLAAGASKMVYFYLNSTSTATTTTVQSHNVRLYSTRPDLIANSICDYSFSFSGGIESTIAASANKITSGSTSPNPGVLGGELILTSKGDAGTVGAAGIFAMTPATDANWPANAYRLVKTEFTIDSGPSAGTYTDTLFKIVDKNTTTYTIKYTFVATGITTSATSMTPINEITSGSPVKHTDTGSWASLGVIEPATNQTTLRKSVSATTLATGGTVTYTITLNNTGIVPVTLDDIVDVLPSSPATVSYVPGSAKFNGSAISNPNISGQTLTFLGLFTVPAGGTSTLTYQATIPNTLGTYTNSAIGHISSTQIDETTNTSDNAPATAKVSVGIPASLTVTKNTSTSNVTAGGTANYTITVSNAAGSGTATNVNISDALPSGFTYASTGTPTLNGGATRTSTTNPTAGATNPSWGNFTIPAGGSVSVPFTVNVGSGVSAGTYQNPATVNYTNPSGTTGIASYDSSSSTQEDVTVVTPTYSINGTLYQDSDGNNTFNNEPSLPANITVKLLNSAGTTTIATTTTDANGQYTFTGVSSGSYKIQVDTTDTDIPTGLFLTTPNNLSVTVSGSSVTNQNFGFRTPDLTITKTHSGNFIQGQIGATYTLTATNSGGAATSGTVTVSDSLPIGLTPKTASGTGWTCAILGQTVTCTRSDALAAGSSYPAITLTADVGINAASSLTNTASVSGGGETKTNNNSATDIATISLPSDLTITKTHTGTFTQGQTGSYTLTATNSGINPTIGTVTVTDTLPTGLTYKNASGTGWTCSASGQTVTCTRSDVLAIASSYPAITLTVDVAANAASSITNTANVSGGGEIKTDNNSASDSTTINAAAPPANTSSCPVQYQEIYSGGNSTITGVQPNSINAIHVDSGAAAVLTNQALTASPNSLATDHNNRLVYYAAGTSGGTSLYAWDVINNTHITITSNISSFASGIQDLSGGGAAFYNGSLYLGVDNPNSTNANNPRVEIYKVNFVSGSNGRTIQSVTPIGLSSHLGVTADWGDFTISNSGVIYGSTGATGGLWKFDLNTNTFTTLNSSFPTSQLAKSSDGRLWAIGPSISTSQTIQQLDPVSGNLTGTARTTTASADGAECVRGISSIGDRVWSDRNSNGTQDTGESGIANVTIALYRDIDGNGTINAGDPLLATQTTDANGNYNFTDLVLGKYIVKVTDTNNVLTKWNLTSGSDLAAVNLGSNQNFTTADFGYHLRPKLLLVKRITAINGNKTQNPNDATIALNTFVNDPNSTADDDTNWPTPSTYLTGAINGGKVKPGDEVEYTIYFLDNQAPASNVAVCDLVPTHQTLVSTGYNTTSPHPTESGAIPTDTGIGLASDANSLPTLPTVYLTNVNDSDRGRYYPPFDPNTPSTCKVLDAGGNAIVSGAAANTNGAVVVDVVRGTGTANQLPPATAPGTPPNSYGFIRFKAKVN